MAALLIVDDEGTIRDSLEKMLLARYQQRLTIHQAENGLQAMELVCSIAIDLIVTDIKMPVCTGLEMLEKLQKMNFCGEVIVVSGFDDYALIRQAMKSGAVDYLLKPIDPSELFALTDACLLRLDAAKSLGRQAAKKKASLEERIYREQYIISQLFGGAEEIASLLAEYPSQRGETCMTAVLDVFQKNLPDGPQKKAWASELMEKLDLPGCQLIQGKHGKLWTVVFLSYEEKQRKVFAAYMEFLAGRQVKLAVAGPCARETLAECMRKCELKLEQLFFDIPAESAGKAGPDTDASCMGDARPSGTAEQTRDIDRTEEFVEAVCRMDFEASCQCLQSLFACICYERPPVAQVRQQLCSLIYSAMQRNNAYIRIIGNYKFTENDIIQAIQTALFASSLKKEMIRILHIYLSEAVSHTSLRDDYYIQKAKEYIGKNYATDITLASVAEFLCIHPNYFSSLFKKKTGISFTRFLRQVRVEEACRLIRQSNHKLYKIAELTGYHDAIQFNRAFREETGMAPGAYRKQLDV